MALSDEEGASTSRRTSSRRKAPVRYDENVVKIHPDEEANEKANKQRRRPPKKRRHAAAPEPSLLDNDDEEEASSEDPQGESTAAAIRKPPAKKKRKTTSGRGPAADRTCPHCGQVCSSKSGLKYHLDHFVCRPALNPNKTPANGKKRPAAANSSDRKPKRRGKNKGGAKPKGRGPVASRTCPNCQRVFTSILGLDYHVKNKVCVAKLQTRGGNTDNIPFPTLQAGSKFVTAFGVVQVIADDRETPAAVTPNKKRTKRSAAKFPHVSMLVAIRSRVRRGRLSRLYETGQVSERRHVFKAYFGGDPRAVVLEQAGKKGAVPFAPPMPTDPLSPSFPDRIVECVLIPDERSRHVEPAESESDDEGGEDGDLEMEAAASRIIEEADSNKSPYGMKLFLRRRTLTDPYVASATLIACEDCGAFFSSKVGYDYHRRSRVCVTKSARMAAAAQKHLASVEEKAAHALKKRFRPERKKSKKNVAVYPQVWLALGFEFVAKKPPTKPEALVKNAEEAAEHAEPIDDVLRRLKNQLKRDRDRKLGTVYPGVFESLQFRRPPPRWKIAEEAEKKRKRQEQKARREKMKKLERQLKPPPAIIDIQVLANEVDAGRYPSMKRHSGENDDACFICRNGGELLCCDFCTRSVHLECIRKKHTIKDPEPQEDFMCHICIQYIMARRNRAEKRRIQKQKVALKRSGLGARAMSMELAAIGSGEAAESAYHDVAALGHELRDLTELLSDAKGRLRQAIGVSSMNDTRRSMLEV